MNFTQRQHENDPTKTKEISRLRMLNASKSRLEDVDRRIRSYSLQLKNLKEHRKEILLDIEELS